VTGRDAIQLICLDLDGTALDSDGVHWWLADEVVGVLNLLAERSVRWCPNSGRSGDNQFGMVQACRELTNMPIAMLAGERYVYWTTPRWRSHEPFNSQMHQRMNALHPRVLEAVKPHRMRLRESFDFTHELDRDGVCAWCLADETVAPALAGELNALIGPIPNAKVLRNKDWLIITHELASKGMVLREAAHHLGIPTAAILAIGDNYNDLDMLDPAIAGCLGCPADAVPDVIDAVRGAGGYVSELPGSAGTVNVIRRTIGV
jgi:hydroxymethylpyrimidine pyrophosphatase-like HAD family hydrolase